MVDEGFNVEACEDVVMLHNADEEVCRKHLRSFQQIAEIGFPSRDVHQALIASSFDHQKALDQLIRWLLSIFSLFIFISMSGAEKFFNFYQKKYIGDELWTLKC